MRTTGGEQRRLALAIAMAVPANFFLLDEPTANTDQKFLLFLLTTLRETRNQGKGIMIVSHDIHCIVLENFQSIYHTHSDFQ